jgi:hypothetical protein
VLERLTLCSRVLLDPDALGLLKEAFLTQCKVC